MCNANALWLKLRHWRYVTGTGGAKRHLANGAAEAEQQQVQRHVAVAGRQAEGDQVLPDVGGDEQVGGVVDAAPEVHPGHRVQRRRVAVLLVDLVLQQAERLGA